MTPKVHLTDYLSATPAELAALPDSTVDWLVAQAARGAVPTHEDNGWWMMCGHLWNAASPKPIADIGYCREWSRAGPLLAEMATKDKGTLAFAGHKDGFCVGFWTSPHDADTVSAPTAPRAVALAYLAWRLAGLKSKKEQEP